MYPIRYETLSNFHLDFTTSISGPEAKIWSQCVELHYNRIENLLKFENTDSEQALINREIAGTMDPPIWNMCAYCVREKHLEET